MRYLFIATSILFSACASIHEGNFATSEGSREEGQPSSSGVLISGAENTELSSHYFGEVDFTFENRSPDWIRIKSVNLDFGDAKLNSDVKIPIGADLVAWAKAAEQNKEIRDYNTSLVLGSALALSAVAISASQRHSPGAGIGTVGLFGAAGGISIIALQNEKDKVELAKLVPPSHLLADEFVIPPGLHTKKWVTFYTKDPGHLPYIRTVTITYVLENGKTEKARLDFRTASQSSWQNGLSRGKSN